MIEIIREKGITKKILIDGVEQKRVSGYVIEENAGEISSIKITYIDLIEFREEEKCIHQ